MNSQLLKQEKNKNLRHFDKTETEHLQNIRQVLWSVPGMKWSVPTDVKQCFEKVSGRLAYNVTGIMFQEHAENVC